MRILITGANGFIGSFLVEYALNKGFVTYAGVRKASNRQYLNKNGIHNLDLNYADKTVLKEQLSELCKTAGKFDYIVHNAGVTKCNNKSDFDKINYQYTRNFVEALIETDMVPTKFLLMSSLSAWGPGNDDLSEIKLNDPPQPDTIYGKSKLKAEQFIESIPNFPYIFARPTGVYGPREKDYFIFNKTISRGLEPAMGFETQYLTFIYVADLVRFVFTALESNVLRKAYFVAESRCYTNDEYAQIVKNSLGIKRTLKIRIPLAVVKFIAYSLDTVCGWFGKSPTLNIDKYKLIKVKNWKCETAPLKLDLNFECEYDLQKGMDESITWYKNEEWL